MKSVCVVGLALVVVLPSFAKDHQAFALKVFTSPNDQFWVNSTIIEGAREVMLVDYPARSHHPVGRASPGQGAAGTRQRGRWSHRGCR